MANVFSKLFKHIKRKQGVASVSQVQNIISGLYGSGGLIQDNLLVKSCIDAIAQEMKKLKPRHVRVNQNEEVTPVFDSINNVLLRPNPWMTMPDLIEKLVWTLELNFNAYVYPVWSDSGELLALWQINGSSYELVVDASNETFLKVTFNDGTEPWVIKYDQVIHLRKQFSLNDFFGGNIEGGADIRAIKQALKLTDSGWSALCDYFNGAGKLNGYIKVNTFIDDTEKETIINGFNTMLSNTDSGVVALGTDVEYKDIPKKPLALPSSTMEILEDRILRYFGLSHSILSGDFNSAQYEAFYQKTIEPLCVTFSEAFTKGLFTTREQRSFGNRISFYQARTELLSPSQKLEMVRLFGDRGAMFENEARALFGLPPIPELEGVRMQSLNYIDVTKASEYQQSKNGLKKSDDDSEIGTDDDNNDNQE